MTQRSCLLPHKIAVTPHCLWVQSWLPICELIVSGEASDGAHRGITMNAIARHTMIRWPLRLPTSPRRPSDSPAGLQPSPYLFSPNHHASPYYQSSRAQPCGSRIRHEDEKNPSAILMRILQTGR